MASRPTIVITGPDRGGFPAWWFAARAIRLAGGCPVRVTPSRGAPAELDGLIVGGGADVAPDRYGAHPLAPLASRYRRTRSGPRLILDYVLAPVIYLLRRLFGLAQHNLGGRDLKRDELELALLSRARDEGIPTLGICRGAQLMNILAGGTLHQDRASFYTEQPLRWTVFPRVAIEIARGSRLAALLGRARCYVNSLHRQAVNAVGRGLVVVARDGGGMVQAIEGKEGFWLGVQWHPEYMPQVTEQRALFEGLVDAARSRRGSREVFIAQRRKPVSVATTKRMQRHS